MKKNRNIIILFLVIIAGSWFSWSLLKDHKSKQESKNTAQSDSYWTCPMHPQVHMNHSGNCPICGMNLVKVEANEAVKPQEKATSSNSDNKDHEMKNMENKPYFTCPMHPQIHQDHPGECPICHMKLILEKNPKPQAMTHENRAEITLNDEQLSLASVQKQEVEKMTLRISIPVSGRFISSSKVAFQIYESDLRYVKAGLKFRGESSFYPEKELYGVISSIDSIVDPTSRTVRAVGSIQNTSSNIASETGFRGDIEFNLDDRIAIPESAVLHTGNSDLVYVFSSNNKLTPTAVKLGLKSEGFYDVLDGLEVGQIINAGANFLIDSEAKIRGAASGNMIHNH